MSAIDAKTARGLSQLAQRATPVIEKNFSDQHPLLKIVKEKGNIKWGGFHTDFEWYIRQEPSDNAEYGGGELGIRTFEEVDPVNKVSLPYTWIEQTYGISEKSIETNRHAGSKKIFDIAKENLSIAQIKMYRSIAGKMWDGASDGDGDAEGEIVGLQHAFGNAYETTGNVTVSSGKSYANRELNASGITSQGDTDNPRDEFDDAQWAPVVIAIDEVPGYSSDWQTSCLRALSYMEENMAVTADVSGTGQMQRPDYAFMAPSQWNEFRQKIVENLVTWQIPIANKKLNFSGWKNTSWGGLTVVRDPDVPADPSSSSVGRVIILDSDAIQLCTTHTKKEGLITNDYDAENVMASGSIGVLKANLQLMIKSPTAIGAIVGC